MDSSQKPDGTPFEKEALPSRKMIEHPDDFFRERGIEPSSVKFNLEYETPEEMQFRLKREDAELTARLEKEKTDNSHKQKVEFSRFIVKELSVYAIGILLIVAMSITSTRALMDKDSSQDAKVWAKSTLTAIATAVGGYLFGKSSST